MAKVFSAKRNRVEFEFEFSDGQKAQFAYKQLTQNEIESAVEFGETKPTTIEIIAESKKGLFERIDGDEHLKQKMLDEICANSTIGEFEAGLEELLKETRRKK